MRLTCRLWLTLSLCFLCSSSIGQPLNVRHATIEQQGAIIRSDSTVKKIYLCFTAHEFGEGFPLILNILEKHHAKASFFFTGDFIRSNPSLVKKIYRKGHYVGPHSDKHLLYCDWNNRDSLLLPLDSIRKDLTNNIQELKKLGILTQNSTIFMPPYEWYNSSVYLLCKSMDIQLVNFTPGTSSNADYTTPDAKNYLSSETIFNRILNFEKNHSTGLNGFHLLIHGGTDAKRKDKLYSRLDELMDRLKGYKFVKL